MEIRIKRKLALAIISSTLVHSVTASVSFTKIQTVVGFSDYCTKAYGTTIANCNLNDFPAIGGTGSCSTKCEEALLSAQELVKRACQGQQAPLNSLIGQLFAGDVVSYLCTVNNGGGAGVSTVTTKTVSTASISSMVTASSQPASSNTKSASFATDTSTASTATKGSNTSTSESTLISTSSSSSSASSTATSESPTTTLLTSTSASFSTSSTSSTTAAASSTKSSSSQGSNSGDSGGGSPFDGNFGSGASPSKTLLAPYHFLFLCLVTILFSVLY
ncbi:hypothetical protein HRR83_006888 [Exophiala dermatitidis]|uniref:Extracellular membrane protein CFEM domain-containing protein n=1 Tax=Exophiala dermatitidis TaxID=5970 RepID=A0AAN6ER13_EXODE|nr:hypothetical protein HRR75_005913 [Exophiala dermatitidis]KAJ4512373.1 hypothetical protein HRR73_005928 [Exophiala dermatitidis]KAJ4512752.1 hypothetical protein HRR74_006450 [Exophiala dermatitidis]KAJ4542558.1 hypothetical protein HRR77_005756 [Exophiala dermatitidis]KAJ4546520.1 hypothetical protein HRR78_005521 [Exophiala dermatitidis]